jgi:hypothetical protein
MRKSLNAEKQWFPGTNSLQGTLNMCNFTSPKEDSLCSSVHLHPKSTERPIYRCRWACSYALSCAQYVSPSVVFFPFFHVAQVAIIPQEIKHEWQWSHRRFSLNGEKIWENFQNSKKLAEKLPNALKIWQKNPLSLDATWHLKPHSITVSRDLEL